MGQRETRVCRRLDPPPVSITKQPPKTRRASLNDCKMTRPERRACLMSVADDRVLLPVRLPELPL